MLRKVTHAALQILVLVRNAFHCVDYVAALTCMAESLMTKPPAETVLTNSFFRVLLLVNRYAARGFVLDAIIS